MLDKGERLSSKVAILLAACAITCSQVIPANSALEQNVEQRPSVSGSYEIALLVRPGEQIIEPDILIEKIFSSSATSKITRVLNSAASECRSIAAEYRASCTAQAYKRAARAANRPDYAGARKALSKASRDLSRLVSRNADKAAPKKKSRGRTYKAVKKAAVKKVARQAVKIITETQTKLLRSSGTAQRKTHYQRIAKAVGSTKVIFRS